MGERHDTILIKLPLSHGEWRLYNQKCDCKWIQNKYCSLYMCKVLKEQVSSQDKMYQKYTEEHILQVFMYLPHSWSLEWLHICMNKGTAASVHMHGRTNRLLFVSCVCEESEQQPLLQAQTREKDHSKCHHMGVVKHLHLEVERESWWWTITEKFQGSASGSTSIGPCAKVWEAINKFNCFLVPDGHEPGGPQCSNLLFISQTHQAPSWPTTWDSPQRILSFQLKKENQNSLYFLPGF